MMVKRESGRRASKRHVSGSGDIRSFFDPGQGAGRSKAQGAAADQSKPTVFALPSKYKNSKNGREYETEGSQSSQVEDIQSGSPPQHFVKSEVENTEKSSSSDIVSRKGLSAEESSLALERKNDSTKQKFSLFRRSAQPISPSIFSERRCAFLDSPTPVKRTTVERIQSDALVRKLSKAEAIHQRVPDAPQKSNPLRLRRQSAGDMSSEYVRPTVRRSKRPRTGDKVGKEVTVKRKLFGRSQDDQECMLTDVGEVDENQPIRVSFLSPALPSETDDDASDDADALLNQKESIERTSTQDICSEGGGSVSSPLVSTTNSCSVGSSQSATSHPPLSELKLKMEVHKRQIEFHKQEVIRHQKQIRKLQQQIEDKYS